MLELKAQVVDAISKKTGNAYTAIKIIFPNGYVATYFPTEPEKFMLHSFEKDK